MLLSTCSELDTVLFYRPLIHNSGRKPLCSNLGLRKPFVLPKVTQLDGGRSQECAVICD